MSGSIPDPPPAPDAPLPPPPPAQPESDFASQAAQPSTGFFAELRDFLRYNKKWWITPIVVMLVVIGVLILLGSTAAGPFIYTLF